MDPNVQRASIIGDGAMGTVCALILAGKGIDVRLWSNFEAQAADLQRDGENKRFLPGCPFPSNLIATADVAEAFDRPQLIVSAVPCQFIRPVWCRLADYFPKGAPVVTVSKGIEIDSLMVSTQIIEDVLGDVPVGALSGPSIAPELAQHRPCTVVSSSEDASLAELVQRTFSTSYFRVYRNYDLLGVELAGATKNVIALAAGIVDGIEAGCNAKAALLTRGVVEISRLGVAMGASEETFHGLAGIGDLVTTCISPVGRNRTAGERIGRGMTAEEVVASTASVIEGIPTTGAVLELASRCEVEMPITSAVASVLSGGVPPKEAIAGLMTRELKPE